MATFLDLVFAINKEGKNIYYHRDTKVFDRCPLSSIELKNIHTRMNEELTVDYKDPNNVRFLTFEEIDHKEVMKDFIKFGGIYDKEIRKQLFNALRYHDYVEPFLAKLKELNLYDDFIAHSSDYYESVFSGWIEENEVELN